MSLKTDVEGLGTWWGQRIFELARQIQAGDTSEFENRYGNRSDYSYVLPFAQQIANTGEDLTTGAGIQAALGTTPGDAQPPETTKTTTSTSALASDVQPGQIIGADEGLGLYGNGFVVSEDGSGFFHAITPEQLADMRNNGVVPTGIDPGLLTAGETIRLNMQGVPVNDAMTDYNDSTTGIGYSFGNGDFNATSIMPDEGTPTFVGNPEAGGGYVGDPDTEWTNEAPPTTVGVTDPVVAAPVITDPVPDPVYENPGFDEGPIDPVTGEPVGPVAGGGGGPFDPVGGGDTFDPDPEAPYDWGEGYGAPPLDGGGGVDPNDYAFEDYSPGQDSPWGHPGQFGGNKDFYRNQFTNLLAQSQNFQEQQGLSKQLRAEAEAAQGSQEPYVFDWRDNIQQPTDEEAMYNPAAQPIAGQHYNGGYVIGDPYGFQGTVDQFNAQSPYAQYYGNGFNPNLAQPTDEA